MSPMVSGWEEQEKSKLKFDGIIFKQKTFVKLLLIQILSVHVHVGEWKIGETTFQVDVSSVFGKEEPLTTMQARTSWLGSSSAEKDLSDVVDSQLYMGLAAKNTDHGLCSEEHCLPGEVLQCPALEVWEIGLEIFWDPFQPALFSDSLVSGFPVYKNYLQSKGFWDVLLDENHFWSLPVDSLTMYLSINWQTQQQKRNTREHLVWAERTSFCFCNLGSE